MRTTVTIAERPDLAPVAARWLWDAFWHRRGSTLAEVEQLVRASGSRLGPPQCFMLLVDGEPVGTASLIHSDLAARPDLSPWLAGLCVAPALRGRGYGAELVRTVEAAAGRAAFAHLWLYTHTADRFYARLGWRSVETFVEAGTTCRLMRRDLA